MTRFFLLALLVLPSTARAGDLYMTLGAGREASSSVTLRDADCEATNPPALFGCGGGADGLPLAARGDLGRATALELGIGSHLSSRVRVDLALTRRNDVALDARANFIGVTGEQPVNATARSLSGMLRATVDLGPRAWRVRPFVTAGGGASRNAIGAVTYRFPGISPEAATITRGGTATTFAWSAAGGLTFDVTRHLSLDVEWRHSDLGETELQAGSATIIRPNRQLEIAIAGTRLSLEREGLFAGLRYRP